MVESVVQSHAEIVVDSTEKLKIRVLHVDDELGLLKVAKQCLELQGPFHVDTAGSVEEALNKLKDKEYDAVVSDYLMPGKDGLEFLEMLRKSGNTIPFVMFTGKGREEVAVKAWSLGADHYVNKTGDMETVYCELAHSIRQTVEKKRALEMRNVCQQRFFCLVENAAAGVGIFDPQGRFTYVNDALANLLGYPARELAGRHFSDFLHKEDKARILESFRQFSELEIEPPTLEFRAVRKDGRLVYLMAKPTKSEIDGKIVGSQAIIVDVTERKKMEQDLVDNQERLQRIFSASPDAITVSDINGDIVECNQATLDILELSSKEELIGKSGFEFVPEKDHQRVRENLGRALEQGSVKNVEYAFLTKSGREIPTELSSSVLQDSSGKIVGFVSVAKDVTERKKAEERVFAERDRLETVTRGIGAGLAIISKDYRTLWANDVLKQIFGDVEGKICYSTYNQRNGVCPGCGVHEIFETGKAKVVHEQVGKGVDGKTVWSEITATPVKDRDGSITAVLELVVPITGRKRAEGELRDSEEKYKDLTESIENPFFAMDRDFRYTYWNKASEKLTGIQAKDAIGRTLTEIFPDVKGTEVEQFYQKVVKTKKHQTFVNKYQTGGEVSIFELDAYPTQDGLSVFVKDITKHEKAEEALKKREAELSAIIENTSDSVWSINNKGRLLFANTTFKRQFSLAYGVELKEGMDLKEAVPASQVPFWVETHNRVLKGGRFSLEHKLEIKGVPVEVEISVNPIIDENGETVGATYFSRDITDRKKTMASEQTLKALFESAPDGIYLNDLKGTFIDGNEAAEEITGFKREELIGKSFLKLGLLPKKEILKAATLLAKNALGKPTGPDEMTLRRKDGTDVSVEIRTFPVKMQDRTVVLGIARDVTERMKIQKTMAENQARFKALFVGSPEAGVFLDRDFRIADINPRFEELFGYSLAEIKGKHIDDVVVPSDKMEEARALDSQAIQGYAHRNTWRRRKDGSLVPVSVSAAPIIIEGRLVGYIGIYKDISELRNTQKKLETMNEKLRVVGGLTRHDVRNKLSTITGNIYLHKKKLVDHPDVLEGFNDMQSACEQIVRIFEFARDYERLGIEELAFVDVGTTIDKTASLFSGLKEARVMNECHGLTVLADSLLERLFYNLIDNSLKYGEKLTQIRIRYEESENQLKLVYEDDGVGISKDNKAKLFNGGFTTGKGSGYGLYLIGRMMDVYGWTIDETGVPGKGAQFTIDIPKAKPDGRQNYRLS
jgi:PAS domain S-box-containing protein